MAFDFGKIASSGALSSITEPTVLFDALPNKVAGYGYLRAVQSTVLTQWSDRRDERDIVVKTNTGGGKTVVGLLMLQCSLNEGMGPALYLAPDPHLAERVLEEAANLGLATVSDPLAAKFLSGEAICVTTMQTLLNGKTRFGLLGPAGRDPLNVKAIIIDDAHAALALTEENTQLVVPASHAAYTELMALFEEDLKLQALNAFLDIQEYDRSAVLRVPFWSWQEKHEAVLSILRPHRNDPQFEWAWPLVGDLLPICQAVVSADAFEIMPPCPPIEKFPSFSEASRRVYLTATLADDSVLVTHFDADPLSIAKSIVPDSAADLGDRLVLAPQELNPEISHDEIRALARTVADCTNVVVLVPSKKQATLWASEANLTVSTAADISSAVERLKNDHHVGLVVIINRYDGIDLPDDACRLLVIDSLPFAFTGVERREAVALRDSEAMVTRQLQRLEQGMGRGVRSRDDRCAILLVGPRLTQLVARADVADRLSPATRAQLALSRKVASQLEGSDSLALLGVINQVIAGDADFRARSREALLGVTYGPATLSATAKPLRDAYNSAVAGRNSEAAAFASAAVEAALAEGDVRLAGWLGETQAAYIQLSDQVSAQIALDTAGRRNGAVLRPITGLEYEQIKSPSRQSEQAAEFLIANYPKSGDLIVGFNAMLSDIAWDNSRTDEAEAAIADLGRHLGMVTQEPERHFGIGSDVLWALGNHSYAVIEAKTGSTAPLIWKKDINQLGGSVNWCTSEYGSDAKIIPVMIHPSNVIERTGTPPAGTKVITTAKLKGLKEVLRQFSIAVAQDDGFKNAGFIHSQLEHFHLTSAAIFDEYSEPGVREPK